MAPMRHKDPLGIDRRYSIPGELGGFGNGLNGPIELSAESISQGAVPGSTGEQQERSLLRWRDVDHLRHVSESRSTVLAQAVAFKHYHFRLKPGLKRFVH